MLERPVESLLMNQADHFRETQEERELLNQVMPLINTGYVRSQLASLPCVRIREFVPRVLVKMSPAVYITGQPSGQRVLESPAALRGRSEWHRLHPHPERAGEAESRHTRGPAETHSAGDRFVFPSTCCCWM